MQLGACLRIRYASRPRALRHPAEATPASSTTGAVAQLGERRVRNAKVEGSIPFRSTTHKGLDNVQAFFFAHVGFGPSSFACCGLDHGGR